MKIHSAPFFESSSLKTRFSSKNAKILGQKQKRRKKRSLETQGIDISRGNKKQNKSKCSSTTKTWGAEVKEAPGDSGESW